MGDLEPYRYRQAYVVDKEAGEHERKRPRRDRRPLLLRRGFLLAVGAASVAVLVALTVVGYVTPPRHGPAPGTSRVPVGYIEGFPPGQPQRRVLDVATGGLPTTTVYVVDEPGAGLLAVGARPPGVGCDVTLDPGRPGVLTAPCAGATFDRTGVCLSRCVANLTRYDVQLAEDHEVVVDAAGHG